MFHALITIFLFQIVKCDTHEIEYFAGLLVGNDAEITSLYTIFEKRPAHCSLNSITVEKQDLLCRIALKFENCESIDTGSCSGPTETYEIFTSGMITSVQGILSRVNRGLCGIKINGQELGCSGSGVSYTEQSQVQGVLVGMKWLSQDYMKFWQPVMVSVQDHIAGINAELNSAHRQVVTLTAQVD
jgi:hypothetical protein